MRGGVVFRKALTIMRSKNLSKESEHDLITALERARVTLPLLRAMGVDAGLSREVLLTRVAAILFNLAAANVADDLVDGDCDYLPHRVVPGTQYVLQVLFFETLTRSGHSMEQLTGILEELVTAAAPVAIEVRTKQWTFPVSRLVAETLTGGQYATYLRILWAGTPLDFCARQVGRDLGVVGHITLDFLSNDRRITDLSDTDRQELLAWTWEAVERLREVPLPSINNALKAFEPVITQARRGGLAS